MAFPESIIDIVVDYATSWVFIPEIQDRLAEMKAISRLSLNPRAVDYLDQRFHLIDWRLLAANPAAGHLLWSHHTYKRFKTERMTQWSGG